MLETVRGSVRRLFKKNRIAPDNAIIITMMMMMMKMMSFCFSSMTTRTMVYNEGEFTTKTCVTTRISTEFNVPRYVVSGAE